LLSQLQAVECAFVVGFNYLILLHCFGLLEHNRILDVDAGVVLFQLLNQPLH
jgi:hypothetical protein